MREHASQSWCRVDKRLVGSGSSPSQTSSLLFSSLFGQTLMGRLARSSSFIGPLVVGFIADATGSIRLGFIFLVVVLIFPVPILAFCIDMEKGRKDAEQYASEAGAEAEVVAVESLG
jgi:MFS-type transporter involved in bile tolerance (Atg22 family)